MFMKTIEETREVRMPRRYSMVKRISLMIAVAFLAMFVSLAGASEVKSGSKVKVFVGILPIAYFVERVGAPYVEVSVLVGPGQDPHTFDPTPKLVRKLAEAQVLFKLGFPFEETLSKKIAASFKNLRIVDLQQGIQLRAMTDEEEHSHGHGHKGKHAHTSAEMDPHTWLDPRLAKTQAKTIADTLIQIDPDHREDYEKNLKELQADLDTVHERLANVLAPLKGKSFYVFHPAYGYFGETYGLKQIAIQLGGKEPTPRQLARLIESAKGDGVRVVFVQPQFSKKSSDNLAKAINGAVVPLDDLAGDYLKNLLEMAAKIESALRDQK
jgi:zinc transport system substrate-binding protein